MQNDNSTDLTNIKNSLDELKQEVLNFKAQLYLNSKPTYTTEEVLKLFGVTAPTLRKWRNEGLIGYSQIGSTFLYSQQDIDNFLKSNHNDAYAA